MGTTQELKLTIRCKPEHFSQAIAATQEFINSKKSNDGTSNGWIFTFDNNVSALAKVTKAGNYSVVVWEDPDGR